MEWKITTRVNPRGKDLFYVNTEYILWADVFHCFPQTPTQQMFRGVSNNRSSRVPSDQPLQVEKQVGQFYEQQLWQQVLASVLQHSL